MATEASPADMGRSRFRGFISFIVFMVTECYYVYVLHSLDFDRLYVGQTVDPVKRLERHNRGSETFTAPFRPWKLIWCVEKPNRKEAMVLEQKLKNLSRERLEKLLSKYPEGKERAKQLNLP